MNGWLPKKDLGAHKVEYDVVPQQKPRALVNDSWTQSSSDFFSIQFFLVIWKPERYKFGLELLRWKEFQGIFSHLFKLQDSSWQAVFLDARRIPAIISCMSTTEAFIISAAGY